MCHDCDFTKRPNRNRRGVTVRRNPGVPALPLARSGPEYCGHAAFSWTACASFLASCFATRTRSAAQTFLLASCDGGSS
jgi:hypothetical protein